MGHSEEHSGSLQRNLRMGSCAGWLDGVWWRSRITGYCLTLVEEDT